MSIATQIIGLIASLSLLVFVHELGHYTFARIFHTRVDKFYLFFNPGFSILRAKKFDGKWHFSFFSSESPASFGEHPEATEWGIGWLPLGGYCAINGMVDETTSADQLSAEVHPWEFRAKPAWQRLFIIIGGVLVNFIVGILIYIGILFHWGKEYIPVENAKYGFHFSEAALNAGFQNGDMVLQVNGQKPETMSDITMAMLLDNDVTVRVLRDSQEVDVVVPADFGKQVLAEGSGSFCIFDFPFVIDSIMPNHYADKAGLMKHDSLVAVNDSTMMSYFDFKSVFEQYKGKDLMLSYYRNDSLEKRVVHISEDGLIGVAPVSYYGFLKTKTVHYGFFQSIPAGAKYGFSVLGNYVKQFKLVFTKEGAKQMGGFGTIGGLFPKSWDWEAFWSITALLSLILAFMNFLPIPMLDGGYILFILIEMITRRKPSDKFVGYANYVGLAIVLALLIYANGMDVYRAFFK